MNGSLVFAPFDLANAYGQQGELWVHDLIGHLREGAGAVEVKHKSYLDDSFFIECWAFSYRKWVPSGLARTAATVWVFVIAESQCAAVFPTDLLKAAVKKARAAGAEPIETDSATQRTRGYLLSWKSILGCAA